MKTQKTTQHKMNRATYSGSLAMTLISVFAAAMFAFPTIAWSQTAEWMVYNKANSGLPYNGVTGLAVDAQGNIWAGTGRWYALAGGGLAKFDGESWAVYNTGNSGLPNNDHTGLAVDNQGNVWCGTESGLAKFDGSNWTRYNTGNSGLLHNLVSTPSFDAQGNMWIGSYGGGLAKFDGKNWTVYRTNNSGLPHNRVWATAFDAQGNLWIGTLGGGLARFDGENWMIYNTANSELPNNDLNSIVIDNQGNLWIGTNNGLAKFDTQDWTVYKTNNSGLPYNSIWILDISAQGNIWIGTSGGGLVKFDGNNWTVYNTSNSGLPHNNIYSIAIDEQGNVWCGTESGGLAVYHAGAQLIVDFNGDGIVDAADMCIMVDYWGTDEPLCDIGPTILGDGIVDVQDLIVLAEFLFGDIRCVAHFKLDEIKGSIANDSARNWDATVYGNPEWQFTEGIIGGALHLDGFDDYVKTGFLLNPADGALSVFAWVKGGCPGQVVVSQAGGLNWLCTDTSEGNLMTKLVSPGRHAKPLKSQTNITDGNWHHIGLVWDGVCRMLYVDDVMVAEDTQDGLESSYGGLYIGSGKGMEPDSFWSGLIDDVRIYNRAVIP